MNNAVEYMKDIVDPEELLRYYSSGKLHVSNNQIRCCCPIHKGKNPTAFVFNLRNNLWFCHTDCKTGGDIYDLVMQIENIDFVSAVKKIAEIFNVDISNMEITMRTNKVLQDTKRWLAMMRGMLDTREIVPFDISSLGEQYPINSYRQFDKETLNHFGITYAKSNQRVVVPIYYQGTIVGATMRRTAKHPIKWMHQPTGLLTGQLLFNIDNIIQSDTQSIIVCEGVWDVLNFYQNGYPNAVATFGCHLTEHQEKLLLKHTYNVIMAYDTDEAGKLGTKDAIKRLRNKINIKVADIPNGKDAGDLDKEEIRFAFENARNIFEWSNDN